jgi:hypothetical protein
MNQLSAYRMKSDAELRYIAKDAAAAAQAMKDHDPAAEAKYLDQVNDAFTVLYQRHKHTANNRTKKDYAP